MAQHRIGQDPAEVARQRSARASTAAGPVNPAVETDIAAYRERSKARRASIPTPGTPLPAAPAPEPVEVPTEKTEFGLRRSRK